MPKISAKLKWGHPCGGSKGRLGRLNASAVTENWRLSTQNTVNLVWSQVDHTEHPSHLFAARLLWCSMSRGFVSDSWSLYVMMLWLLWLIAIVPPTQLNHVVMHYIENLLLGIMCIWMPLLQQQEFVLRPFVRVNPGEPVPEEIFTHPPSWLSSNLHQLLPSTTIP